MTPPSGSGVSLSIPAMARAIEFTQMLCLSLLNKTIGLLGAASSS